jgi:hypothetical protein
MFHTISSFTTLKSQLSRAQYAVHHELVRPKYETVGGMFIPAFSGRASTPRLQESARRAINASSCRVIVHRIVPAGPTARLA